MRKNLILLIIGLLIIASFACSKKETFNKKIMIYQNFGVDEQDKFFLTNDDMFESEIINNIHDVAREMNIKNSSGVMFELQGKDIEKAKQIIFEHLNSNGIDQNRINFEFNQTDSDTTIIKIMIK